MSLYNITGQEVLKQKVSNLERISLQLNSGVYIVKIQYGQHRSFKKLIVK